MFFTHPVASTKPTPHTTTTPHQKITNLFNTTPPCFSTASPFEQPHHPSSGPLHPASKKHLPFSHHITLHTITLPAAEPDYLALPAQSAIPRTHRPPNHHATPLHHQPQSITILLLWTFIAQSTLISNYHALPPHLPTSILYCPSKPSRCATHCAFPRPLTTTFSPHRPNLLHHISLVSA